MIRPVRRLFWVGSLLALWLAPALPQSPESPIQAFQLESLEGAVFSLDQPDKPYLLLVFWNPEISRSLDGLRVATRVTSRYPEVSLWTIVSGNAAVASIQTARESLQLAAPVLIDPQRRAFAQLKVIALPTFLVVGPDLRILFRRAGMFSDVEMALTHFLNQIFAPPEAKKAEPDESEQELLPIQARRHLRLAQVLFARGQKSMAGSTLSKLADQFADSHPVQVAVGYTALEFSLWSEAESAFNQALQLMPEDKDTLAGRIYLLAKTGREEEALHLKETLSPENPRQELIDEIDWQE